MLPYAKSDQLIHVNIIDTWLALTLQCFWQYVCSILPRHWTQDLQQAEQELYNWSTAPPHRYYKSMFIEMDNNSNTKLLPLVSHSRSYNCYVYLKGSPQPLGYNVNPALCTEFLHIQDRTRSKSRSNQSSWCIFKATVSCLLTFKKLCPFL